MGDVKPKDIVISSLAMRFHVSAGWTLELLQSYVKPGYQKTFVFKGGTHEYDPEYWLPDVGTILDVDRLYADGHVGKLPFRDQWSELKNLTDLQVLKERNW